VTAEIVDDDNVAGPERRYQNLLDIGQEALTIDRPIDHAGRIDAVATERGEEGQRSPTAMRRFGDQPPAPRRAPVGSRHVGLGPSLVDEHQAHGQAAVDTFSTAPAAGRRPDDPARWRAVFFEADTLALKEVPTA
jgi:hypothetical protein